MKQVLRAMFIFNFLFAQEWMQNFEEEYIYQPSVYPAWQINKTSDDGFIISSGVASGNKAIKLNQNGNVEWVSDINSYGYPKYIGAFDNGNFLYPHQTGFQILDENGAIINDIFYGQIGLDAYDGKIIDNNSFLSLHTNLGDYAKLIFSEIGAVALWEKEYENVFRGVDQTASGEIFLTGYTSGFTVGPDSATFIKADSDGQTLWEKKYFLGLDNSKQEMTDGISTSDSAFVSIGVRYNDEMPESGADLVIIKLDENGDSLWTKIYGGQYHDYSETIVETFNGNYLISGYKTQSYETGDVDAWLLLLDSNGDSLWSNTYSSLEGGGNDKAYSVVQVEDGSFVFCGLYNDYPFVAKTEYAEPLVADPCDLGVVFISEAHNSGDPEDYIEIYNSGDSDCSLEGFQLDDEQELQDFTFGEVIIQAGAYWVGYENSEGSFTSELSSSGGIIVFADSDNNSLIVTLEPSQEFDGVQLSQSFDSNGLGCYTTPSPGQENTECITLNVSSDISMPIQFTLHQNYPNPFNPTTNLSYDLVEDSFIRITVYDVLGNVVNNLVNANQSSGYKSLQWNATNNQGEPVSAGVYLYTIEAGDFRQSKKMILLK